jgi:hypothetical protein
MIIPLIFGMTRNLERFIGDRNSRGFGVIFARKLLAAIHKRFPAYQTAIPDCLATFLDPRFKGLLFAGNPIASMQFLEDNLKEIGEGMIKAATARPASSTQSTIIGPATQTGETDDQQSGSSSSPSQACEASSSASVWDSLDKLSAQMREQHSSSDTASVDLIHQEVEQYMKSPVIPRTECPLQWWARNASNYKTLSILARGLLSIPATQVKSERLNSTSGNVVDNRGRLTTEHVMQLTFLHENLHQCK